MTMKIKNIKMMKMMKMKFFSDEIQSSWTKGSLQIKFLEKFGILSQLGRTPPSPLPESWDTQNWKEIDVYFAF